MEIGSTHGCTNLKPVKCLAEEGQAEHPNNDCADAVQNHSRGCRHFLGDANAGKVEKGDWNYRTCKEPQMQCYWHLIRLFKYLVWRKITARCFQFVQMRQLGLLGDRLSVALAAERRVWSRTGFVEGPEWWSQINLWNQRMGQKSGQNEKWSTAPSQPTACREGMFSPRTNFSSTTIWIACIIWAITISMSPVITSFLLCCCSPLWDTKSATPTTAKPTITNPIPDHSLRSRFRFKKATLRRPTNTITDPAICLIYWLFSD